jgi:Flp pilus assembly protein TadG
MVSLRSLWADTRAASAAEFALVLPLLMLLMFGVIDAGRFMWEYNKAEKATQVGARMAVVTNVVAGGIATTNFVGTTVGGVTLTQGDRIPASALPTVTCTNTSCTCSGCPSGIPGTYDSASFSAVVQRMQYMMPAIQASNVIIEYRGSGLGFAGDPNGAEVSPLVTVKLTGVQFKPLAFLMFKTMNMPEFATTLTAEDLSGTESN